MIEQSRFCYPEYWASPWTSEWKRVMLRLRVKFWPLLHDILETVWDVISCYSPVGSDIWKFQYGWPIILCHLTEIGSFGVIKVFEVRPVLSVTKMYPDEFNFWKSMIHDRNCLATHASPLIFSQHNPPHLLGHTVHLSAVILFYSIHQLVSLTRLHTEPHHY